MARSTLAMTLFTTFMLACGPANSGVDRDGDGVDATVDCDDLDSTVFPGADERCDGVDQDCDGIIDNDPIDGVQAWTDQDIDGYGGGEPTVVCRITGLRTDRGGDCDDAAPNVHPGADERCTDLDMNCDGDPYAGAIDTFASYFDKDGDGWAGTALTPACTVPEGASGTQDDCDDNNVEIHPDAYDQCDLIDQNCDGTLGFDAVVGVNAESVEAAVAVVPDGGSVCIPTGRYAVEVKLTDKRVAVFGQGREQTFLRSATHAFEIEGGSLEVTDLTFSGLRGHSGVAAFATDTRIQFTRVNGERLVADGDDDPFTGKFLLAVDSEVGLTDVALSKADLRGTTKELAASWGGLLIALNGGKLTFDGLSIEDVQFAAPIRQHPMGLIGLVDASVTGRLLKVQDVALTGNIWGGIVFADGGSIDLEDVQAKDITCAQCVGLLLNSKDGGVTLRDVVVDRWSGENGTILALEGSNTEIERLTVTNGIWTWAGSLASLKGDFDLDITNMDFRGNVIPRRAHVIAANAHRGKINLRNIISAGNQLTNYDLGSSGRGGWFWSWGAHAWPGTSGEKLYTTYLTIENAVFMDDVKVEPDSGRLITAATIKIELINTHLGPGYSGNEDAPTFVLWIGDARLDHVSVEDSGDGPWLDTDGTRSHYAITKLWTDVTPDFVDTTSPDPVDWDLHLNATSPLIDAGSPILNDPDGSRSDIGAYGGAGGGW